MKGTKDMDDHQDKSTREITNTNKQPRAADGRRNIANYTCEVVADLDSPNALAEATADHEVKLIDIGAGELAYGLTLKGRLVACRAVIDSVTKEMREVMNEMAKMAHPSKTSPLPAAVARQCPSMRPSHDD